MSKWACLGTKTTFFSFFLRTDFNCIQVACGNLQKDVFRSAHRWFFQMSSLQHSQKVFQDALENLWHWELNGSSVMWEMLLFLTLLIFKRERCTFERVTTVNNCRLKWLVRNTWDSQNIGEPLMVREGVVSSNIQQWYQENLGLLEIKAQCYFTHPTFSACSLFLYLLFPWPTVTVVRKRETVQGWVPVLMFLLTTSPFPG